MSKKDNKTKKAESKRLYAFPTLGKSVKATSYKEACKLVGVGDEKKQEKKAEVKTSDK